MSITARALLVGITSVWTANKLDKNATDVVISETAPLIKPPKAEESDGRFKPTERHCRFCGRLSSVAQHETLPWANSGARILDKYVHGLQAGANDRKASLIEWSRSS